mgnify:FL=1
MCIKNKILIILKSFIYHLKLTNMKEWYKYYDEFVGAKEWSEQSLRGLIKNVLEEEIDAYHWQFVEPIERQLKKEGISPYKINKNTFYPKRTSGKFNFNSENKISEYHSFIHTLGILLYKEGYLHKTDHTRFVKSFDGIGNIEKLSKIEWVGAKNQCTYLIDSLVDHKIILETKLDENIEHIFEVKNPDHIRKTYHNTKNKKPKGHIVIDQIIESSFNANPFMVDTLKKDDSNLV